MHITQLKRPWPPAGLINPGRTCYINSVLQILYHIPLFRWVFVYFVQIGSLFFIIYYYQAVINYSNARNFAWNVAQRDYNAVGITEEVMSIDTLTQLEDLFVRMQSIPSKDLQLMQTSSSAFVLNLLHREIYLKSVFYSFFFQNRYRTIHYLWPFLEYSIRRSR